MKERPIRFSDTEVRAILEGRKTQTRRVISPQPEKSPVRTYKWKWTPKANNSVSWNGPVKIDCQHCSFWVKHCPHGAVGDRLWVREKWYPAFKRTDTSSGVVFPFESGGVQAANQGWNPPRWKPSIHMPRWASRITLEITGVRVERLQEISEWDVAAEGTPGMICGRYQCKHCNGDGSRLGVTCSDCKGTGDDALSYWMDLWKSINGPESWSANPWVWVIEFRRVANG